MCSVVFDSLSWTVACQVPLSTGFSRQEFWSGLQCPPLGDLPDPGIEPVSPVSPALAIEFFTRRATCKVPGEISGWHLKESIKSHNERKKKEG